MSPSSLPSGKIAAACVVKTGKRHRLSLSDRLDRVLAHAVWGALIMLGVLYAMFQVTIVLGSYPQGWLEGGFSALAGAVPAFVVARFWR